MVVKFIKKRFICQAFSSAIVFKLVCNVSHLPLHCLAGGFDCAVFKLFESLMFASSSHKYDTDTKRKCCLNCVTTENTFTVINQFGFP
jgi:hypothetical protein